MRASAGEQPAAGHLAVRPDDVQHPQLERLVVELEELREEEKTPVVRRVIEEVHQAIRRSGYLLFIGD